MVYPQFLNIYKMVIHQTEEDQGYHCPTVIPNSAAAVVANQE